MDHATACFGRGSSAIPDQHGNFFIAALVAALADPTPEMQARFDAAETPQPPLTRLVIQLILIQAESDEFVREVCVDLERAHIYRGSGEVEPSEFRLTDLITNDFGLLPAE